MRRKAFWVLGWPARAVLLVLIRAYRVTLAGPLGGQCRFFPSCSVYAEEAVRTHGAVKGTALTAWRLLRCSPLSGGGIDPVPARNDRPSYEGIIQPQIGDAA